MAGVGDLPPSMSQSVSGQLLCQMSKKTYVPARVEDGVNYHASAWSLLILYLGASFNWEPIIKAPFTSLQKYSMVSKKCNNSRIYSIIWGGWFSCYFQSKQHPILAWMFKCNIIWYVYIRNNKEATLFATFIAFRGDSFKSFILQHTLQ